MMHGQQNVKKIKVLFVSQDLIHLVIVSMDPYPFLLLNNCNAYVRVGLLVFTYLQNTL